jgi:DNA-binding GntR family transcriptional regulator
MKENLAARAYETLRERVVSGDLPPGTRLVNRTLAKELGISFTPVREAINQLASEGLVDYVRGGGAFVRTLDRKELAELYDLRMILEPYGAKQAALRISSEQIEDLESICSELLTIAHDLRECDDPALASDLAKRWSSNEERFHATLLEAAENRWLAKTARDLQFVSRTLTAAREMPELLSTPMVARTWKDHRSLIRFLRNGDGDGASEWMERHIRRGRDGVLDFLKKKNSR